MVDETSDHLACTLSITNTFTSTGSYTKFLENVSCGISNILIRIFKNLLKVLETILHQMRSSTLMSSKGSNKKCSLFSDLLIPVLKQSGNDGDEIIVDHLISRFLMMDEFIEGF